MRRRSFVAGLVGLALAGPRRTWAAGVQLFDKAAFAAAQNAGKPIVVFVHASW